jgi:hypothetical protein
MESKKPAKRSKFSQLPINNPLTPQDVSCKMLTPNSCACTARLVLPPSPLPQTRLTPHVLRSPREVLKRHQLSPLLLPQIDAENEAVDDERRSNNENYDEQGSDPSFALNSLKVQRTCFPPASRKLQPKVVFGRRLENLIDIGVELDCPDDNFGSVRVDET